MKPRWLLLGVSVLCLLVLFPASVLSQGAELQATCGSADVDGVKSPGEWDNAGVVAMFPYTPEDAESMIADLGLEGSGWDVSLAQPGTATGWLYAMNDQSHLYLALTVNLDSAIFHPDWWLGQVDLFFADEPGAPLGEWAAPGCGPPVPGEGWILTFVDVTKPATLEWFAPQSRAGECGREPIVGVQWKAGPGSVVWEYAFDLNASELDKVGPGDCFHLGFWTWATGCDQATGCPSGEWLHGEGQWPQSFDRSPATFGEVCLDPCEEFGFVPEPGSILLLGSGLMGLAGYATLRWRARE